MSVVASQTTDGWLQLRVLRRRLMRQLQVTQDLSPPARARFDHLVAARWRLDPLDRHLRAYNLAHPGEGSSPWLAAAGPLSEAVRRALGDLAVALDEREAS